MQAKSKTGKPIKNKVTKLPIYTKPVDLRINEIYKELVGMTKQQAQRALSLGKINQEWQSEIKSVMFTVKMSCIQSELIVKGL